MTAPFERVAPGVVAIDTGFGRARMDASYLLSAGGRAAFIDCGTHFSVPNLLAALAGAELAEDAVDYLILTHVHLDHAGGIGRLAAALPRARVLVHPRGVPHVIDPTILAAATEAVYGAGRFAREYGCVSGVPAARVEAVEDGSRIRLGSRTLEFVHTPGHALHHLCVADRESGEVFAGDTFGVSYRELDTAAGAFIFPTTSPSQFDPVQLHASIERVVALRPQTVYLTHYGPVREPAALASDLHRDLEAFVAIAAGLAGATGRVSALERLLFEHLSARLARRGFSGGEAQRHALLDGDVSLNAAGLDAWLARRRA